MERLVGRLRKPRAWMLPAWFLVCTVWRLSYLSGGVFVGADASLYTAAARSWMASGDPWDTAAFGFHFANLPPTLIPFALLTWLPDWEAGFVWAAVALLAGLAMLRRLRLPIWWLLFPPLAEGIYVGNPQVLLVALLVTGVPWAEGLSPILKIYALVPLVLLRRWRALILAAAALAFTVILWPDTWLQYVRDIPGISARMGAESFGGFSAWWIPEVLVVPTAAGLLALWLMDRQAAAWLAVPALWPATQFFYSTFALPLGSAGLAAILAVPLRGTPSVAVCAYAATLAWRRRQADRLVPPPQPVAGSQAV